jgi:hypothetical protein
LRRRILAKSGALDLPRRGIKSAGDAGVLTRIPNLARDTGSHVVRIVALRHLVVFRLLTARGRQNECQYGGDCGQDMAHGGLPKFEQFRCFTNAPVIGAILSAGLE